LAEKLEEAGGEMKHIKTVKVPETTRQITDFVTCDLCGVEITCGNYEVDEVEISCKTGSSYPEGGCGEEIVVDMCSKCFENELIPWLKSKGVKIETKPWEW